MGRGESRMWALRNETAEVRVFEGSGFGKCTVCMSMVKVLLVDDDVQLTRITRRRLENVGFEAVVTHRSLGVLNLIATSNPDVVVMDLKMPGLRGEELVSLVRKDRTLKGTRILIYSGMARGELRARCGASGANGFVHKMDGFENLVSALRAA